MTNKTPSYLMYCSSNIPHALHRDMQGRISTHTLTLILCIAIIGGCGYLWYQQQLLRETHTLQTAEIKKELRELDQHPALTELKTRLTAQADRISGETKAVQTNVIRLDEAVDTLAQSLLRATDIVNRNQRSWALAEVGYLFSIANTRIELMRDKETAIAALIAADQRLLSLADTRLLELRKKLSEAITQLKLAAAINIDGAMLKLMSISEQLYLLPSATSTPIENADGHEASIINLTGFETTEPVTWWVRMGDFVRNILGIHPEKQVFDTLAKQKNRYYLDQLIRIELEAARQALIRQDRTDYENRLTHIGVLIEKHYDQEHRQVIHLKQELTDLRNMEVFVKLPNIAPVIDELTGVINRLEQTTVAHAGHSR